MSSETARSLSPCSPLSALQAQLERPRSLARFDAALSAWSRHDPALGEITNHGQLTQVLDSRDYPRQDEVLFTLLRRAATLGDEGFVASELVMHAMVPSIPGITGRVVRAARAAANTHGVRRGVRGAGVSAGEASRDIQATVIGHLWERVRCYPLRRRHHVAANLVLDTQRGTLRSFGVELGQVAADVVSIDDPAAWPPPAVVPAEADASEELLGLLSQAAEQQWLDEHATAILTMRYFGDQIGRDGVATDRQIAAELRMSQPTVTRHRLDAIARLTDAVRQFADLDTPGGLARV